MRLVDALASGLKAAALVVLLALAWATPATAHSGHIQPSNGVVGTSPQVQPRVAVDASLNEAACVCLSEREQAWTAPNDRQRDGTSGRACCGTMCTVALIERGIAPLPLRTPHGIRLAPSPETLSLARSPGLHARPPRTLDIA
ncbi:MAG: hypothetical protein DCF30_08455 [Hyphomicrobiales bacterium]|nr:MAG: hypothetical protein DCF30_08455 [Hyphomicrobiales bacterium]